MIREGRRPWPRFRCGIAAGDRASWRARPAGHKERFELVPLGPRALLGRPQARRDLSFGALLLVISIAGRVRKTKGPIDANDRVKAKVFAEAAFTDDDLTLEYVAEVMAASGPNDDSGAAIVAQIGRLSALQLRFHYVVYRQLRRLWPPAAPMNLYAGGEAQLAGIQLTRDDLVAVIGEDAVEGLGSVALPLVREGLVAENFQFTDEQGIAQVRPTGVGAELFLWGHGVQRSAGAKALDNLRPAVSLGVSHGLAVYALSFKGWIPALEILPSPQRDRPGGPAARRPAARRSWWPDVVYGAVLGRLI
jgi:hypothetical protein